MKEIKAGGPEQAFVSDITYIKSGQQVHYLSLVTDACSRKIMELYLSDDMRTEHVVIALKRTVKEGLLRKEKPVKNLSVIQIEDYNTVLLWLSKRTQ